MKKRTFLAALVGLFVIAHALNSSAQNYWVFFNDKTETNFDPYSFFDTHTIERRIRHHVPLISYSDLPVNPGYIQSVSTLADSTGYASRWFNAVAVVASQASIDAIAQLPFVGHVESSLASFPMVPAAYYRESIGMVEDELAGSAASGNDFHKPELIQPQVQLLGMDEFVKKGLNGEGVIVAVFDGGFPSYQTHPAFRHIQEGKKILHTWDFTKNKENVDRGIAHGTMVLSCIAGIIDDQPMGLATQASFILAITELRTEPFREEQNWLAAAEWAEKYGADIINSSLGYTAHRYFNSQMDGKTALVSRAANMAATKGILVVNAAGNDGSNSWKIMCAPADADSVLSIGGIDPSSGYHTSFSSYGPTSDNRLKPNVVASGHVYAAGKKGIKQTQGTSFASPLVAGFAACAWQSDLSLTNMELFRKIEQSGHLFPYYDYAHGFGLPQAAFFTGTLDMVYLPTFTLQVGAAGHFEIVCQPGSMSSQSRYRRVEEVVMEVMEEAVQEEVEMEMGWEELEEVIPVEEMIVVETLLPVEEVAGSWEEYDEESHGLSIEHPKRKNFLYMHVRTSDGVIKRYMMVEIDEDNEVINTMEDSQFEHFQLEFDDTLCVSFKGWTECYKFRKR